MPGITSEFWRSIWNRKQFSIYWEFMVRNSFLAYQGKNGQEQGQRKSWNRSKSFRFVRFCIKSPTPKMWVHFTLCPRDYDGFNHNLEIHDYPRQEIFQSGWNQLPQPKAYKFLPQLFGRLSLQIITLKSVIPTFSGTPRMMRTKDCQMWLPT